MLFLLLLVIFLISSSHASTYIFTQDCHDNSANQYKKTGSSIATCSPSFCSSYVATNSAAVDSKAGQTISNDYISTQLSDLGCQTCTQSTDDMCTSSSLSSTIIAGYGLKVAYCTDEYLILISTGKASHTDGLSDIPRPPGDGISSVYSSQTVTRSYHEDFQVWKVPVSTKRTYRGSTVGSSDTNYVAMSTQTDPTSFRIAAGATLDVGLPTSGPIGISISGQQIYPVYNNVGYTSMETCEMDRCNAHAGKGFDYHYHGDPFSTTSGRCMYSPADYIDTVNGHPPIIGWALDGYVIYGRHLSTSNIGYSTNLDDCGGHQHGAYGYHYHSQVIQGYTSGALGQATGTAYNIYVAGPYKCFAGDISNLNFFGNQNVSFKLRKDYIAGDLQPCCSSTKYYAESGIKGTTNSGIGITSGSSSSSLSTAELAGSSSSSLSTAELAGIIVGSVVGFILLVAGSYIALAKSGYITSAYVSANAKDTNIPAAEDIQELEMGQDFQAMSIAPTKDSP